MRKEVFRCVYEKGDEGRVLRFVRPSNEAKAYRYGLCGESKRKGRALSGLVTTSVAYRRYELGGFKRNEPSIAGRVRSVFGWPKAKVLCDLGDARQTC